MSTMVGTRPGTVAIVTAALVMLAACGQSAPVVGDEPPVAVAEQVPFEGTHLSPRPTPEPTPEAPPEPSPEPSADSESGTDDAAADETAAAEGPSRADAAAFVASDAVADLQGLEHVVVDLDGDERDEVVATGMRDRTGQVRIAWWTSGGYEVLAADQAGTGRDVTDLRAADVNQDDRVELLVEVEGEGLRSLAVWSVTGRGEIQRLEAVGGCHDGAHVFGVTRARLKGTDGPPAIVADCDESPLPVADWSQHRWVWQDGAYRHVAPERPDDTGEGGRPDDDDRDDRDDDEEDRDERDDDEEDRVDGDEDGDGDNGDDDDDDD